MASTYIFIYIYIYINTYIYIYIYTYIHTYIFTQLAEFMKKTFRSDLSIRIKKTSPLTNYLLQITFSYNFFVLNSFVMMALVLISHGAFSLCTIC